MRINTSHSNAKATALCDSSSDESQRYMHLFDIDPLVIERIRMTSTPAHSHCCDIDTSAVLVAFLLMILELSRSRLSSPPFRSFFANCHRHRNPRQAVATNLYPRSLFRRDFAQKTPSVHTPPVLCCYFVPLILHTVHNDL